MPSSSSSLPSTSVDVFGGDGVDRRVFAMDRTGRRWLLGFAFLLSFALPVAWLLTSPLAYDLRCTQVGQQCTVTTRRAFVMVEHTTFAFAEVTSIEAAPTYRPTKDRWSGEHSAEPTGRSILEVTLRDSERVTASFAISPTEIPVEALTAHMKGAGDSFAFSSTLPFRDTLGVGVFFLFGLLLVAWTRFRTVVAYDTVARVVSVERAWWPAGTTRVFRAAAADIKDVGVPGADGFFHAVFVDDMQGRRHHIGRFLTSFRANDICAAITDAAQRGRQDAVA